MILGDKLKSKYLFNPIYYLSKINRKETKKAI